MLYTPQTELSQRIETLQENLRANSIDAALIAQNADMFYYAGTVMQAFQFIPAEGEPYLFVMKGLDRAERESALTNILPLASPSKLAEEIRKHYTGPFNVLGIEGDVLPYNLANRYAKMFQPATLHDISGLIRAQRMVKSDFEIEHIRRACQKSDDIFAVIGSHIREGMTEFELVAEIERISRSQGHPAYIRPRGFNQEFGYVQLLTGPDSIEPSFGTGPLGGLGVSPAYPHGPSNRIISRNEPIMLDYEGWHEGYVSDMSRTYVIGELPEKLIKAYEVSVELRNFLLREAKVGENCNDLFEASYEIVKKAKLEEHFMGVERSAQFMAHGLGLEVDELPVIAARVPTVLEEGMILALENKFTFPEGAVGIEDTCVVRKDGLENLCAADD